jgi:hypothetical protein
MTHPITPPPELVQKWLGDFFGCTPDPELSDAERFLATRAAQYGADQELEACCEWVKGRDWTWTPADLRAARRPKPLSLKQQALAALHTLDDPDRSLTHEQVAAIRRALEQLDD